MPPLLVGLAGWILPGLGYMLIGEVRRGVMVCVAILGLFIGGLFVGGVRVVDVPGYGDDGQRVLRADGRWTLTSAPLPTVLGKSWFVGQFLAGPVTLMAGAGSLQAAASGYPQATAHLREIATLYCAVAGMLNLVVLIDAAHRSSAAREHLSRRGSSRRRPVGGGA